MQLYRQYVGWYIMCCGYWKNFFFMTVNLEYYVNKIVEHLLEELTSEDRVARTLVGQFTKD